MADRPKRLHRPPKVRTKVARKKKTPKKWSVSPLDLKAQAVKLSHDAPHGGEGEGDGGVGQPRLCAFCHRPRDTSELEAGEFFQIGPIVVHYFCVLFSSQCRQRGTDEQGLFGCFLSDIQAELKRGARLLCHFCDQPQATVVCSFKGCQRTFHYTCGRADGCIFVFTGNMKAYCAPHGPRDRQPPTVHDLICLAGCSEKINSKQRCITSPCCGRRYHYHCLQSMALASGLAHFKCPICSEKSEFAQKCVQYGVYIPNRDAAWEQPSHENFYQFAAMGQSRRHCDAPKCLCDIGRSYHKPNSNFQIVPCTFCGSRAVHIKCGRLDPESIRYICETHGDDASPTSQDHSTDASESSENETGERADVAVADHDVEEPKDDSEGSDKPQEVQLVDLSTSSEDEHKKEVDARSESAQSRKRRLAFEAFKARLQKKSRPPPASHESEEEIEIIDPGQSTPPRRIQLRNGHTLAYIQIRDRSAVSGPRRSSRQKSTHRPGTGPTQSEESPILILGSSDED
ncbi:hypothetical protein TCAL_09428 [Tigriopus californicus]|uniref:PHD-type domain-containing protein n=1 Tax=Tigriopus californicus TaxID=6832 RepID=A0A553PR02_TIGCA|nr:PHD finger protein 7-like [Tigriopus californicus]TRY80113.1 hypothetical protein TCAL_09428 [Tigriopus californicus]|eukprot:TCALIF_09428-PA protein Name:"Similar to PHF7 PHD finger protein 7 (Homo sapiens)" AED:0.37 eAED:0.37 QI:194/1/1/1/1/1/5/328/512